MKGFKLLWHIVLPQLRPATSIAMIVSVVGALRSFDLVSVMTDGGPYQSSTVLAYYMYDQTFGAFRIGYGAAIASCLFFLMDICIVIFLIRSLPRGGAEAMFPIPIETASPARRRVFYATVWICLFVWLLPIIAIAITSIRSVQDLNAGNYWGWPTEFSAVANYTRVFTSSPMLRFLFNSMVITLVSCVGALALSAMAGFALSRYRFRGSTLLLALFIAGNFVPFQMLMIPVRDIAIHVIPVYDTIWALVIFHIAFQTGFCTLFMRNFIAELPGELIEAARVEGVSEIQIFFHVILPLVRPALAALFVLVFTFVWNDYFWSLVLVQSDSARPVTAGLQALRETWTNTWHLISAGSLLAAVPPVLVFFLMQRQFIAGLTFGATKG
nr:ABC transporter permease subunit [Marinicella sp. W31]MDC2875619.1 ABC transporter permease subunit [Marinicella sp. W31]